jgi:radical SAM superfamily enzyme YgiQ (UPF0313 family)
VVDPHPAVLLLSCYELGHQPLSLASPLAFLARAGIAAEAIDLGVDELDDNAVRRADFVAISVPMHTALRLGLVVAQRVRKLNTRCQLGFFGHYATLNAAMLVAAGADVVLGGECDEALASWAAGDAPTAGTAPPPYLDKLDYLVPLRDGLPELDRYVHLERADGSRLAVGSVESSRGCRHLCRHCPLPPVYGGRFFVIPQASVLADIRQLVERGARHINFVDPDFLNGPRHALDVVRAMHLEHPEMTFDFTAKVEHLLKRRDDLAELGASGCAFIVSAVESLSNRVLEELHKGHTAEEAREALTLCRDAGIDLRPTFVAFTPWTTLDDYRELFRWVIEEDLVHQVDPIQLALRLLVPPGTLLLDNPGLQPHLGALDSSGLTYRWTHPDPEMDRLQVRASAVVEAGAREGTTHHDVLRALAELVDLNVPPHVGHAKAPRLTEAWFC